MTTARDLINASLRLIGAIAPGETLAAAEATDGLSSLNMMLDSWSTESLVIPNKVREVFALSPSKSAYTIGTGGDFDTVRPMAIENILVQIPGGASVTELPVKLVTKDQFAGIIVKQVQSSIPTYAYCEGNYPLETINLWPVPTTAYSLVVYSAKPLTTFTSLDSVVSLPPGYERAIKYALAIEIAPEYGKASSPDLALVNATAIEAKASIKRLNSTPKYLSVDDALKARSAVWNWMTGEPT